MNEKIVSFDKFNAKRSHNRMLIDRIQGVPAHRQTSTHVDPRSPNINICVEGDCGVIATRVAWLVEETGADAGGKYFCDEHWPKYFDEETDA